MRKNLVIIVVCVIVVGLFSYFQFSSYNQATHSAYLAGISAEEMKSCDSTADCVPVECDCSCSGLSYDDFVNKKYTEAWYYQKDCYDNFIHENDKSWARVCPSVSCIKQPIVSCENHTCVVRVILGGQKPVS